MVFNKLHKYRNLWLLGIWIIIGAGVRFIGLTEKMPWTDEFATMVFSLGNTYHSVPLNQIISIDTLLQPLRLNPNANISQVISLLLQEDNHPPLYFILAHLWIKLLPSSGEYVSLWMVRSLAAFLGVLSIPLMYLLGKFTFRSASIGQFSALMMAVSPYGVFLSQEARHYTLAILFVIASLACFIVASQYLWQQVVLPLWLILSWISINCLGLITHYFFSLTLISEIISLFILLGYKIKLKHKIKLNHWLRLGLVWLGTFTIILIWFIAIVPRDYGNGMTDWIRQNPKSFLALISPIFQLLAAWITMLSLLPIESSLLPVIIISGSIMLVFFIWVIPRLIYGIKIAWKQQPLEIGMLLSFVISAVGVFLGITYLGGMDITRGARYSFVYFPGIIALIGASLSVLWKQATPIKFRSFRDIKKNDRIVVIIILLMGLLSAVTVSFNLGYQKYYQSDRLIQVIQENSTNKVLIATIHRSLVQTGEMMGIAWAIQYQYFPLKPLFILIPQTHNLDLSLQQSINTLLKPLDVWTVNIRDSLNLDRCTQEPKKLPYINGYNYQQYHCT